MNRHITITSFALVLLIVGRQLWLPLIGAALVYEDTLSAADAIVPLAGERLRIPYAAELLHQGYARWFVVTDMAVDRRKLGQSFRYADSVRQDALEAGVPAKDILEAPGEVATTYAEAQALHQLAREQGWRSLMVVTSPYHTHRTRIIFHEIFRDTTIAIQIQAVHPHWYNPDSWWTWAGGRQTTALEYLKLSLYLLGYHHWKE